MPSPTTSFLPSPPATTPGGVKAVSLRDSRRPADGGARHDDRERGAAPHPTRARVLEQRPVVGAQRVHPHVRRNAPPWRPSRRSVRPSSRVPRRHHAVHHQFPRRRTRRQRVDVADGSSRAGRRCRTAAPTALSLLTMVFPQGPERVRAIGLYTTVSAAGGALGLVSGGLLTEWVSWRWVMFVNVPIGMAILVVGRRILSESEPRHGRFDLVGAMTSTVGMSGIVLGLVESASGGWTSPLTIGSLASGVILLAVFVSTERKAEEPVLPLRLLAHPTRSTANVARGLVYAGMYGMFFFMGQFLQDAQGYSPLRAGLAFLPVPASVFLASQLTSRVLVRRLPQKAVMLLGISSSMVGLLLVTQLQAPVSYARIVMSLVLMGMGAGVSFVSLTSASLADVAPDDAGAASGLINVSQQLGAAVGLAVLVTIFDSATHHAGTGLTADVFVHGVRTVCLVAAGFAAVAFALVALVVRPAAPPRSTTWNSKRCSSRTMPQRLPSTRSSNSSNRAPTYGGVDHARFSSPAHQVSSVLRLLPSSSARGIKSWGWPDRTRRPPRSPGSVPRSIAATSRMSPVCERPRLPPTESSISASSTTSAVTTTR